MNAKKGRLLRSTHQSKRLQSLRELGDNLLSQRLHRGHVDSLDTAPLQHTPANVLPHQLLTPIAVEAAGVGEGGGVLTCCMP